MKLSLCWWVESEIFTVGLYTKLSIWQIKGTQDFKITKNFMRNKIVFVEFLVFTENFPKYSVIEPMI